MKSDFSMKMILYALELKFYIVKIKNNKIYYKCLVLNICEVTIYNIYIWDKELTNANFVNNQGIKDLVVHLMDHMYLINEFIICHSLHG